MSARLAFVAVCASVLLASQLARAEDKAADKIVFTSSSVSMLNLPIYTADVMGYFAAQKIASEIMVLKTGAATALAAVLAGNANVYIRAPSNALRATDKAADTIAFRAIVAKSALHR